MLFWYEMVQVWLAFSGSTQNIHKMAAPMSKVQIFEKKIQAKGKTKYCTFS